MFLTMENIKDSVKKTMNRSKNSFRGRFVEARLDENAESVEVVMELTNDLIESYTTHLYSEKGFVNSLINIYEENPEVSYEEFRNTANIYFDRFSERDDDQVLINLRQVVNDYEETDRNDFSPTFSEGLYNIMSNMRPLRCVVNFRTHLKAIIEWKLGDTYNLDISTNEKEGYTTADIEIGFIGFDNINDCSLAILGKSTSSAPSIVRRKDNVITNAEFYKLHEVLNHGFKGTEAIDFTCQHVGQGLATSLKVSSTQPHETYNVVYDAGLKCCGKKDSSLKWGKIINYFKTLNPRVVFISHWHTDHYKGLFYCDNASFANAVWVAPDFREECTVKVRKQLSSISGPVSVLKRYEKQLLYQLYIKGLLDVNPSIYLLDKSCQDMSISQAFNISKPNEFTVRLGKGKILNSNNDLNEGNIILKIEGNQKLLLCGDSPYENIPTAFNGELDIFVVPHHGAKNNISYSCLSPTSPMYSSKAIIPTGENPYGCKLVPKGIPMSPLCSYYYRLGRCEKHPCPYHSAMLNLMGFEVVKTESLDKMFSYWFYPIVYIVK